MRKGKKNYSFGFVGFSSPCCRACFLSLCLSLSGNLYFWVSFKTNSSFSYLCFFPSFVRLVSTRECDIGLCLKNRRGGGGGGGGGGREPIKKGGAAAAAGGEGEKRVQSGKKGNL